MRIACLLLWTCLAALALVACSTEADDMGIVARVNGKPIYLSQLEFQHDLLHMDGSGSFVPTVDALRGEYGQILGDLIVLEMISQELTARGLGVTEEELAEEERMVRADYPEDTFEQVLVEEYIDLASWRERLRYHKALQKFQQLVLRPQIKIDYREAEAYYTQHIKDFQIPETLRILVVRSASKSPVAEAVRVFRESRNPDSMKKDKAVTVHELTVRQSQLSSSWLEALQSLPPGEASQIMEEKFGFEALILMERLPVKLLDPTQAYPLVEQVLLEQKLKESFDSWLATAWASADVKVSEHLLPREGGSAAVEPEAGVVSGQQEILENPEGADAALSQGDMPPLGPDDSPLGEENDDEETAAPAEGKAQ